MQRQVGTAATRDKYRVVPRAKTPIQDDEIRIASDGRLPRYVTYAAHLFAEQNRKSVTIKATGNAISVAITLAEIVKRRFPNLHQFNTIGVTTISDTFEPLEEGLDEVVRERDVPFLEIILTSETGNLDVNAPGYQKPIDQSLVKTMAVEEIVASRPRGGRGGRGSGYSRGGRGGWRGGRGRGGFSSAHHQNVTTSNDMLPVPAYGYVPHRNYSVPRGGHRGRAQRYYQPSTRMTATGAHENDNKINH